MVSDDAIIARLNARDASVLEDIRSRYGALCCQMAYRILGNREDAEECVNDMLLAAWNSIPPQLPVSLQAYLITITRRGALSRLRHEQRLKRGGTQFAQALDELSEIIPSGEQIEDDVERRELVRVLRAFIDGMKPETRHIFMQRYFLSESVQDIAEQNHISESKVKMSLLRTRKKLKEYLRKEGLL